VSPAEYVEYLTSRLRLAFSWPSAIFVPPPPTCVVCGRRWWGLDEMSRAVCCGVRRQDMIGFTAPADSVVNAAGWHA
jgi:hypothetical protein